MATHPFLPFDNFSLWRLEIRKVFLVENSSFGVLVIEIDHPMIGIHGNLRFQLF